jgi:YD repeat-containing protein
MSASPDAAKRSAGAGAKAAAARPGAGSSPEARRLAAVILEVLAGLRGPAEAASACGLSLPRYYSCELRALHGLLAFLAGLLPWRWAAPAPALPSAAVGYSTERAMLEPLSWTRYTYDGQGRLTSITEGQGTITTVIYHSPRRGPGTTP